jgi:hypothetical protein
LWGILHHFSALKICFLGKSVLYLGMLKMKLTKSEQEFISENITKFDVVTGITVNDIEIRIHGATLNAEGKKTSVQSTAVYRTNDIKAIYAHTHAECVEAKKAVEKITGKVL